MRQGCRYFGVHWWATFLLGVIASSAVTANALIYQSTKDSQPLQIRCALTGSGQIDLYGVQDVKLQADLNLMMRSEEAETKPLLKTIMRLEPGFLDVTVDGEPNAIAVERAHVVLTHEPTGKLVKAEGVADLDFLHVDAAVNFSSLLATLFLPRLPDKQLAEGDEWSDETTLITLSGQQLQMKRTYRLASRQPEDGLAVMNVEIEVPLDSLKIERENLVMGGVQKASLRQTWDTQNGRLIASEGAIILKASAFADEARRTPVAGIDVKFRIDARTVLDEEKGAAPAATEQ